MRELSLFSGYGGFSLGLRLSLASTVVGYVEIDKYCQRIIQARIKDGFLDDAPIWPDISTFNGSQCRGLVDIITAGFPCQPHSVAGQHRGEADERNLWPDTLRVIRDVGPRFVLLENVPGILTNGYGGTVVGELAEAGYDCLWGCVSAAAVGAPHLRWRWFCLAQSTSDGFDSSEFRVVRENHGQASTGPEDAAQASRHRTLGESQSHPDAERVRLVGGQPGIKPAETGVDAQRELAGLRGDVANPDVNGTLRNQPAHGQGSGVIKGGAMADATGQQGNVSYNRESSGTVGETQFRGLGCGESTSGWWAVEPGMGRVANGVAHRVDRLKALGNGIVPAVVRRFLGV